MPFWPKSLYTFTISARTAATARKLRKTHRATAAQKAVFRSLTCQLAKTSVWKAAGVEAGMSYETFRARVPVSTHAQLAPAIERMKAGEADVLWPGTCTLFSITAGTSTGQPRCVPLTGDLLHHFRRAGFDALLYYTVRARHAGVFRGRHLLHGGAARLLPFGNGQSQPAYGAELSGIAALHLPAWAQRHFYEPGLEIAQLTPWDTQVEAIATRARTSDLTVIGGVPNAITPLLHILRHKCSGNHVPVPQLQNHWPNLQCFLHSGAPVAPYARELRALFGPTVTFHDIYAASECFVATQDGESAQGLRVMADMGVFFEFVAVTDFDQMRLEQVGSKAVSIENVKPGLDYVLLVTTPGGLARYVLGDVVRFTSVNPHRLIYVGGVQLRLNAFNENVTEKEVTDALVGLCQRRDWTLVNFHVAPLIDGTNLTGQQRGAHEWWIELKPGTVVTPTGPQMAAELDTELQRSSETYVSKRALGILSGPTVRLVMPGVFEHWLRFHQKWGGQHKMPRCRSDRLIADELAHITNFAPD